MKRRAVGSEGVLRAYFQAARLFDAVPCLRESGLRWLVRRAFEELNDEGAGFRSSYQGRTVLATQRVLGVGDILGKVSSERAKDCLRRADRVGLLTGTAVVFWNWAWT
ncbi:MAG: hypothetical protein AAGD22_09480 [Verrucomicrobiota bacterium]